MKRTSPVKLWFARHAEVAVASLRRLLQSPAASLMTCLVIAIALALPSGLYLLTANLQRLSTAWDGDTTISLFLKQETPLQQAQQLASKLKGWPQIAAVQLITPEQALEEFRSQSGFGDALDILDKNPLPAVIAVKPGPATANDDTIAPLLDKLKTLPAVDLAQLDLQWVKRLNALIALVRQIIWLVAGLLGLAVLLIVGNTIRLEIQNRKDEINITRLIGATNSFIRRPFLYSGLWYGLIGAVLGWLLIETGFLLLHKPVSRLAGLYDSAYQLKAFSSAESLLLLLVGATLGLAGAWLAVGRHLGDPEAV